MSRESSLARSWSCRLERRCSCRLERSCSCRLERRVSYPLERRSSYCLERRSLYCLKRTVWYHLGRRFPYRPWLDTYNPYSSVGTDLAGLCWPSSNGNGLASEGCCRDHPCCPDPLRVERVERVRPCRPVGRHNRLGAVRRLVSRR